MTDACAYTIRTATNADIDVLSALGRSTFVGKFGHLYTAENLELFLSTEQSPARYAELIADPGLAIWLAETPAGDAAGYLCAGDNRLPSPPTNRDGGEIKRLYVADAHQGAGLGGALFKRGFDWLRESYRDLYLSVFSENDGAQRFYARAGFTKIGEHFFKVGDHNDLDYIYHLRV